VPTRGSADDDADPLDADVLDARLVGPALTAWASAALFLSSPALGGLTAGLLLLAGAMVASRRHRRGAVLLTSAAAAILMAALRVAQVGAGPVPELAAERAVVEAAVVVTGDVRTISGGFADADVVTASVREVIGRGTRTSVRSPVLLMASEGELVGLELGSRVRLVGRLQPPDDADLAALVRVERLVDTEASPAWWWTAADEVRSGLREAVKWAGDAGALVPALVTGDDQGLSAAVTDDFRTSGLTHLLAVSGTNLTLVLGALLTAAKAVGVRGRGLRVVGVLGAVGFVVLARPDPSVLRAAAMGLVALAGLTAGGRRRGLRSLSVAVLVLVLVDPWLARSAGFALSVIATGAIVVLGPPWRRALQRWLPGWAAEAVVVPLAAQLACTPLVAVLSGQVSVVAVAANVLVAPAVGPSTVLGLATGGAGSRRRARGHRAGRPGGGAGLVDRRGGPARGRPSGGRDGLGNVPAVDRRAHRRLCRAGAGRSGGAPAPGRVHAVCCGPDRGGPPPAAESGLATRRLGPGRL